MTSIKQTFNSYDFPHIFIVRFALACAKEANAKIKTPTKGALQCIALVERYVAGEKGLEKELKATAADAAASAAANAAAYDTDAATGAYDAAYDAAHAAYVATDSTGAIRSAAYWTETTKVDCLNILKKMIEEEGYSELEQILMGVRA